MNLIIIMSVISFILSVIGIILATKNKKDDVDTSKICLGDDQDLCIGKKEFEMLKEQTGDVNTSKICLGDDQNLCMGKTEFEMLKGHVPVKISRGQGKISPQTFRLSGDATKSESGIVADGYSQAMLCKYPPDSKSIYLYGLKKDDQLLGDAVGAFDIYLQPDIPDSNMQDC